MSCTGHSAVKVPAPLIYFAGDGIGALLAWRWPWTIPVPRWVGVLLILLGIGLALWALQSLSRAHTPVDPAKPSTALVETGPYRWSRNPIYVAMTVSSVGLALCLRTVWILALLVVVVLLIDRSVIAPEERYLETTFGAQYDAYRRRVRRWL